MARLFHNPDGADAQARAVLAYLSAHNGIEASWNNDTKKYDAYPTVARWHNGREQGYVISMRGPHYRQINIAFFEHRNSDSICAVKWEQRTINPPTIDNAKFGEAYKDKYDVSHSEPAGNALQMAEWIYAEITTFWVAGRDTEASDEP